MKKLFLVLILLLFSCKRNLNKDITISPAINVKDSLLILNIKNNTDKDFILEFPVLENFFYKDQYDETTSEKILTTKSFIEKANEIDMKLNKEFHCFSIKKEFGDKNFKNFKFLNKKSEKIYFLKIVNYRKGKTIIFRDDSFDNVCSIVGNKNKLLSKIKNQKCGKYYYFTGSFEFMPEEIILP